MGLKRALLVLLAFFPAGALTGQETLRSAVVRADLTAAGGGARVRVEYVVDGVEPGGTVSATILTFASSRPADLSVGAAGEAADFEPGPGRAQVVELPVELGPSGDAWVVAEYTIPSPVAMDGQALRSHVPVLSLDIAPAEARPGLFSAEVIVPADWTVSEVFPTGMRETSPSAEGGRTWSVELPVVPATLSFRAHTDGGWHPGLPLVLDVLAALIILSFSFFGWRHLREGTA